MNPSIREQIAKNVEKNSDLLLQIINHNCDDSDAEQNFYRFLCSILNKHGLEVSCEIAGINNSFKATYGTGHPSICYLCNFGKFGDLNLTKHNLNSAINLIAALSLKSFIDEIGGCIKVVGYDSDKNTFATTIMHKNGIFADTSVIINGHAHLKTSEGPLSQGVKILNFTFNSSKTDNALIPCIKFLMLVDSLSLLQTVKATLNYIVTDGGLDVNRVPTTASCSIMLKSFYPEVLETLETEVVNSASFCAGLYKATLTTTKPEHDYFPFKASPGLSPLLCHNLKEQGINAIHAHIYDDRPLDIGFVSQSIPTLHPYFCMTDSFEHTNITEDSNTTTTTATDQICLKAATSLALVGFDLISRPELLNTSFSLVTP